uniref:Uncharacterized protein n=1 Tax=Amphimedon queenslandica TaxID=400682 RepID=A0A1X7U731_AMPQE
MSNSTVSLAGGIVPSDHSMMYTVLSSMTYFIICVAIIFLLILVLLLLLLLWYWCLKPTVSFTNKTIKYSSLQSDEEDEKGVAPNKRRLLFSDILRIPSTTHSTIQQAPPIKSRYHWSNVPANANIDINAGHLLLTYIENNLRDKGRLDKEWESLTSYAPDDVSVKAGLSLNNKHKNRYPDILPYDHTRVLLNKEFNASGSDYINANFITDVDPKLPRYIASQGPLQHTITDFWQSQGSSLNVLHPSSDNDDEDGGDNYSESVQYSRTITQFHYLSWSVAAPPANPTPLLDFWRKVKTAYTLPQSPVLVHCSEGVGRTGTYILIDMTLSRITSGAKEINLAGAVEHLRDQRKQMVKTKSQFEFALDALVQETQYMLNAAQKK